MLPRARPHPDQKVLDELARVRVTFQMNTILMFMESTPLPGRPGIVREDVEPGSP